MLPSLCLRAGLLVCVLRGFSSQLALWRLLSWTGLWNYPQVPVSDQPVYQRLEQDGMSTLERLFGQVTALLATRLAPYRATDLALVASQVVAFDETALDRTLPALRGVPASDTRRLPGKWAAIFDLRLQ